MIILQKRADLDLPHYLDYTTWLDDHSDLISESVWTEATGELTLAGAAVDVAEKVVSVKISGGIAGSTYRVRNQITTDGGLINGDDIYLYVY